MIHKKIYRQPVLQAMVNTEMQARIGRSRTVASRDHRAGLTRPAGAKRRNHPMGAHACGTAPVDRSNEVAAAWGRARDVPIDDLDASHVTHPLTRSSRSADYFFYQKWPFYETNNLCGLSLKLIPNLAPEVGSILNGADLVHVGSIINGADLPSAPILVCAAEMTWRRHAQGRRHPYWRRP